jgi:hypothetical protein
MRTQEEINRIKSRFSEPYSIQNFLTKEDVDHLIQLFNTQQLEPNKVYKNTGPITIDITLFLDDPVVKNIFLKLEQLIGPFELNAGFIFWTNYPHIIHNDDTFEFKDVYKGITIPLSIEGDYTSLPSLCFFDQHYFQGPSKFFNGESDIPSFYNKQVYEYSEVEGTVDTEFDKDIYQKYFTHVKYKWLNGLSLSNVLEWKPTSALIFDSLQLHAASDFRSLGIKSKLAISIFTRCV